MNHNASPTPSLTPLTKAEGKLIRSLSQKKNRDAMGLFLAEGPKVVGELMHHFPCRLLVTTDVSAGYYIYNMECRRVTHRADLHRLSLLQSPQDVLAVFEKPTQTTNLPPLADIALALDGVQDPGNLGTILRTADWMGIRTIYASTDTADCFAPKVVQATMGALGRVKVIYTNLRATLTHLTNEGATIYGTFMQGNNLFESHVARPAVIVMGNEGNGIRHEIEALCSSRLSIPRFAPANESSESLNVAVATAIVLAEIRRQASRQ